MKSLEYIGITEEAAKSIITNRELQSSDFEQSSILINLFLALQQEENSAISGLNYKFIKNGCILTAKGEKYSVEKNTLTVDFETFKIEKVSGSMVLTAVQKLLRFAIKYWGNLSLNNNEYLPVGSPKAIIFPFPITSGGSYRITIDREPSARRMAKRFAGKHLLVYKFGTSEGNGLHENCSETNFNKSIDQIFERETYTSTDTNPTGSSKVSFFQTNLVENPLSSSSVLGQSDPLSKLSPRQLEFVQRDYSEPARIEGPAGSGKTICMVLKCLQGIKIAQANGKSSRFLFICPSQAMVKNVSYFVSILSGSDETNLDNQLPSIEIKTLQDVCRDFLKDDIHESELLDIDSSEAKNLQLLHLVTLIDEVKNSLSGHRDFINESLYDLFNKDEPFHIAELVRHEISVVIKGRCDEVFEKYKSIKRPVYGLPINSEHDRRFIFNIFKKYSVILDTLSQFDTDDIAISALSKLDSPIWRRRRAREGYDAIFIDEVHLFNMNELSLVHYLTKDTTQTPISYAIDLSQALGDIAWNDMEFHDSIGIENTERRTTLRAVFRCTPSITDLAFSITSHGANLFTNFDNPISEASYVFDSNTEESIPQYYLLNNNDSILDYSFKAAEKLKSTKNLKRHQIALIFFDRGLFDDAARYVSENNKLASVLIERGDIEAIKSAEKSGCFIVGHADYVGGLEFEAVVLVGVDDGRVPSSASITSNASRVFQNYIAHNRLYVAVTRARQHVWIIGEEIRGPSMVLEAAIENKKIMVTRNASEF